MRMRWANKNFCNGQSSKAKAAITSNIEPITSARVDPKVAMAAGSGIASRSTMRGQALYRNMTPATPRISPSKLALRASMSCCLENTRPMPLMGLSVLNLGCSTLKDITQPPAKTLAATEANAMPIAKGITTISPSKAHALRR